MAAIDAPILIQQGAEAKIYKGEFGGKPCIIKVRFSKSYRHPVLDKKLTEKRLKQEAKSLTKCNSFGICTPTLYSMEAKENKLYLEYIDSPLLKDLIALQELDRTGNDTNLTIVIEDIGKQIAIMHNNDVIHGDLTTLNIMVNENRQQGIFIDFGLSYISHLAEDKAVDLYVLERAIISSHPNMAYLFSDKLLPAYANSSKQSNAILSKLKEVRQRGRKRIMIG